MVTDNIVLENARIGFRNFEGREGRFNPAGSRNFCVFLDYDLSKKLEQEGWNIRRLQPRNEGDDPQGYLQVAVKYNNYPPKIALVRRTGRPTELEEQDIAMLDTAELASVDLIIRPYNWETNGKTGVKAYLKSMYVKIQEDEFAEKYYAEEDPF